ncbi:MAG: exosortase [Pirellulales bacterium]|nr:exosortase [Pirellulales bacterium]
MASPQVVRAPAESDQKTPWIIIGALLAVVLLAYSDSFLGERGLVYIWNSAQYSHGFLIPIFAIVLLCMKQQPLQPVPASARWGGVGILAGGLAIRLIGARFGYDTVQHISMIPVIIGIFVIAGGWSMMHWALAPLLFLVFMMPLPGFVEQRLLTPLQHIASLMSNYVLQTLGVESYLSGSTITIDGSIPLNVAEACSGLRMSTIFLAMAVAMIMIIERPWWHKAIIVLSSIPIAIVTNMIRIVVTGLMMKAWGQDSEWASHFFHDAAGWVMMPIALGFLYAEMVLLDHLVIEEEVAKPKSIGFGGGRGKGGDGHEGRPASLPRQPAAARQ